MAISAFIPIFHTPLSYYYQALVDRSPSALLTSFRASGDVGNALQQRRGKTVLSFPFRLGKRGVRVRVGKGSDWLFIQAGRWAGL
jgi:hypothetical protein